MQTDKVARVQSNFRKLMNELGDCWFLCEQGRGYGRELTKLLHKYHKISWLDECTMILDEDYFMAHYDGTRVRTDHKYTHSLHGILADLSKKDMFGRQTLWTEFLFGISEREAQEIVDRYNLYRKEYEELLEDARLKWESSGKQDGASAVGASEATTP